MLALVLLVVGAPASAAWARSTAEASSAAARPAKAKAAAKKPAAPKKAVAAKKKTVAAKKKTVAAKKKAAAKTKAALAEKRARAEAREARELERKRSRGKASWYGSRFHGKPTASGETFDRRAMTAAHRDLPFGTRVRVTNTRNGRAIVVRINDRGPFARGRIIDVSEGAARKLGMLRSGTARVVVEILPEG
jgi:rare lipoprotein A